MKRAGVIGHPIAHSKSPIIHEYWLQQTGIAGEYARYDIAPDALRDELMRLRDAGLVGVNVTLPHKQHVMDICTTINQDAQKIGAVNTVVFYPNGEIEGRNTDAYGFWQNIKEAYPDMNLRGQSVLVLGAGGASRACIFALKREGVAEIRLSNRTIENAEHLADEFGCTVYDWDNKDVALKDVAAVINTTSLGMTGKPPLNIDLTSLSQDALVNDIVYAPLMTDILQQAQAKKCKIVTGIGMLLHQARPAFEAFYGQSVSVTDELRAKVLA